MDCNLFELAAQFYINSDQNLSEIIAKFNVLQPWDPKFFFFLSSFFFF